MATAEELIKTLGVDENEEDFESDDKIQCDRQVKDEGQSIENNVLDELAAQGLQEDSSSNLESSDQPLAKPEYATLDMAAPVLVSMNPEGKWQRSKPDCLDEEQLKAVVAHLVNSKAVSAAQSYCCQCAAEKKDGGASNYVPIIMMPLYPSDHCPFDMDCEIQKIKESEPKKKTKTKATAEAGKGEDKEGKKKKKRGFVMQRLNDFDLLSQW